MSDDRKVVRDTAYTFEVGELFDYGSSEAEIIDAVKARFASVREEYKEAIDVQMEYEYYGYDGGVELYMHYTRLETDKEYAARKKKEMHDKYLSEKRLEKARLKKEEQIKKALREKAISEAAERALFEELKAKYGE